MTDDSLSPPDAMRRIDAALSHVWMVRAFLKHSDEAIDDEELQSIHRDLYDAMHALGPAWQSQDAAGYLKLARKKFRKLQSAAQLFAEIQPEVSTHTNFQMAARSLSTAVELVGRILQLAAG